VRRLRQLTKEYDVRAVDVFPCGCNPQVPIDDKRMYVIYAACIDLDLPIFVNVGVPGPRVPMDPQKVERVDEVCWFFPELKFVMRHGAEPWDELAVKLMLKYPNLYYSTSAFAPKHYPKSIIRYANTRGADKVIYAGYFPMGLSLDRIFSEMRDVPFNENVLPKFLYENAKKLLKL
jgi:predicted TIM-barrel fold metal-dependent hydrolase